MRGPLAGLHVVEIASEISGPYAAKLFVDLGAEVTKIEPPTGDPLRYWGPFPGGVIDPQRCGLFEYLNAGKRGATLDLTQPDDMAAARELIAQAHVLVEDFPPGAGGVGLDQRPGSGAERAAIPAGHFASPPDRPHTTAAHRPHSGNTTTRSCAVWTFPMTSWPGCVPSGSSATGC